MTKIPAPAYMSVKDVAAHFGCAVSTVWRWERSGVIPRSFKLGGMTRWRRADIEAVLSENVAA